MSEYESNVGICQECFMFTSRMDKHLHEDHGHKLSDEAVAELRAAAMEENRKRTIDTKIDMQYIGDGPITSK
jgi:hypothetical protein